MSVILTGFMGTGKTTIGRQLAQHLGKVLVDTDQRIEQAEGRSITAIFATEGEGYFRAVERRVVAEAVQMDAVVATGGGAIADPENLRCMRAAGLIICLTADVDVILERTAADSGRPLLGDTGRRARVSELLHQRAAAYAQADVTIDTSHRTIDAVLDDILTFLRSRQTNQRGPE